LMVGFPTFKTGEVRITLWSENKKLRFEGKQDRRGEGTDRPF